MVNRMRKTRSKTGHGRSHEAVSAPELTVCTNCGADHRPHHMCQYCGFYRGRQIIDMQAKREKREARLQAKREMIYGHDDHEHEHDQQAVAATPQTESTGETTNTEEQSNTRA